MDSGIILKVLGLLLLIESAFMVPSLGLSIYYGEQDTAAFIISIAVTAIVGLSAFVLLKPKAESISYKEGFMIVGLGWILVSAFGALPFMLSGVCNSFIDAYFETVSGFTTTGASIFNEVACPMGYCFGDPSLIGWAVWAYWFSPLLCYPP